MLNVRKVKDEKGNKIEDNYALFDDKRVKIGTIEKRMVSMSTAGKLTDENTTKYMHWCFLPSDGIYITNGYLREICEFIRGLYSKEEY